VGGTQQSKQVRLSQWCVVSPEQIDRNWWYVSKRGSWCQWDWCSLCT